MGKKRKAKHVLEAQANKKEKNETTGTTGGAAAALQKKKKRKKKKYHVKDPQEAHTYLSTWQQDKKQKEADASIESIWRFNKNTQSWLIRHMYEVDKISKSTFAILLLYLEDLKGGSRSRVYDDAVRRALRYKNWEKSGKEGDKDSEQNEGEKEDDDDNEEANDNDDDEADRKVDAKRWKSLNDNDKRKEYKRARKIIDVLKVESTK